MSDFLHKSVLLSETVEYLNLKSGQTIVDATLGGSGHAQAVLEKIGESGTLLGFDQDAAAIAHAKKLFLNKKNVRFFKNNFKNIKEILLNENISEIDGILFDLGVSSPQLDLPERGFSWKKNCPLDMRMDREQKLTAADLLAQCSEQELAEIFHQYGEERAAKKIARQIILRRQRQKIEYSDQLKELVLAVVRGLPEHRTAAVSRVFQALRIAVNNELNILKDALSAAVSLLRPGGRIVVITFHSLEDRLVKQTFQELAKPCSCPPSFPKCVCGKIAQLKLITKKPVLPAATEVSNNIRARSAKLRVGEKLYA